MLIRNDDFGQTGLGYLLLDNRNAPLEGLPPLFEADTYTCKHCQRVVIMNPQRQRVRYKCNGCTHHICDDCAALRTSGAPCRTWAQLEQEFLAAAERQANASGIVLP